MDSAMPVPGVKIKSNEAARSPTARYVHQQQYRSERKRWSDNEYAPAHTEVE